MKLEARNAKLSRLFLINRRRQRLEGMLHPLETFRMTDEQIATRLQVSMELIHKFLLSRTVEIDHDVTAKDEVQRRLNWKLFIH